MEEVLKIKDDISLEVLKELGFEQGGKIGNLDYTHLLIKQFDSCQIVINTNTREIYRDNNSDAECYYYINDDCLFMFDMIQKNIVEKIKVNGRNYESQTFY